MSPLQICCDLLVLHKIARYTHKQPSNAHIVCYCSKEGPYLDIVIHQGLNVLSGAFGYFLFLKEWLLC